MCLHSFEYHSLIISSFTNDKRFGFVAFLKLIYFNESMWQMCWFIDTKLYPFDEY